MRERVAEIPPCHVVFDDAPEMMFETAPSLIERLQGDGSWETVTFTRLEGGAVRLASPVLPQRPAIFRWK